MSATISSGAPIKVYAHGQENAFMQKVANRVVEGLSVVINGRKAKGRGLVFTAREGDGEGTVLAQYILSCAAENRSCKNCGIGSCEQVYLRSIYETFGDRSRDVRVELEEGRLAVYPRKL